MIERILGRHLALVTQRVADRRSNAAANRAQRLQQPLLNGVVQQLLDDAVRQLHVTGQIGNRLARFDVHKLQQQIEQAALGNAGVGDGHRNGRRAVDHRQQLLGRQQSQGDQIITQPPTVFSLAFQRRIDVVERYQAATDKQPTQAHDDTLLCAPPTAAAKVSVRLLNKNATRAVGECGEGASPRLLSPQTS